MHPTLRELISLLNIEEIETDFFRGRHPAGRRKRLFGGQVIAQSLVAANKTIDEEKIPHSLHAYFIRPGSWTLPIMFKVERVRNGRSFSTRRVLAIQNGEAILSMDVSFQVKEDGLEHQMREAPSFEPPREDKMADGLKQRPFLSFRENHKSKMEQKPQSPEQHIWFKANGQVPKESFIHFAFLAYQSDEGSARTLRYDQ